MGVTGLWPILAPSARPTPLPTLNRKRLAVDASIWIYQFLKAVRDKEGNALRNSHVVGFFRRICKLLYFGIKPVFVFDGGAPALKRLTVMARKKRREGRREDAVRTAGKLLAVQMKRRGEEEQEQRKKENKRKEAGLSGHGVEEEPLPDESELVYAGEVGMSAAERQATRKFRKTDAYHLPEIPNIADMGAPNDPRIMSAEELQEYARQFHDGEDINLYDFSKIDFNGDFFLSLPPGDRYNILNAARLRSRLRMGLSKEQLEHMFPDRMAFSRFQIERVRERNELTQRLMNLNGMNDGLLGVGSGRIAGERGREYVLVKNEGVEGGWALGVVSTDKSIGERSKPIDVDALNQKIKETQATSESEDEFEDVPVEGLNRLPKLGGRFDAIEEGMDLADQRLHFHTESNGQPTNGESSGVISEDPESLFVDERTEADYAADGAEEDEGLARAIAMSLEQDVGPPNETEEDEHLYEAIALSLKNQHGQEFQSEDEDFEDIQMPDYKQRAVEAPKPLNSSSGGMIAHIINNRASAAVPRRRAASISNDSDSDMDLQAVLAKARKKKAPEKRWQPAPIPKNVKNPFDGPLPFEKLDFRGSIFKKRQDHPENVETEVEQEGEKDEEEDQEDLPGGFDTNTAEGAPKPLPPWLAGSDDIRSRVEAQQRRDLELNAEDRERAIEEERLFRLKNGPIEINSSEDGSDVEVLDGPPPATKMDDIANAIRANPPVSDKPQNTQWSAVEAILTEENQEPIDEQVDWSESEHGEAMVDASAARASGEKERSKLESAPLEFEDVELPQRSAARSPSSHFEEVNLEKSTGDTAQPPTNDAFERQQEDVDEFDLSDPDDEELLAQLAIEAEEHARFASTLNNRPEQQNREDYEAELRALRSQQKKDRRDADEVSQVMITECQALLRLFGIPYITAPMEAEAQCAELVKLGLVDGVVTDDSDIFLFGGTRVYKNMFNNNKFVECYLATDLERELSLSRHQLISIAHLLGSDYTEGLPGIGPVTAVEIISEFPSGLDEFVSWWSSAQISPSAPSSEPSTFRKKFRRAQATRLLLPPGFPSPAVTDAYLHPEVDSSPEPFQWGVPDLDRLRDFLMATIGWDRERTDEVLVPVIRDMNRRAAEGTQSNITRFFAGSVGAGVNEPKKGDVAGSKRMREAVGRLKAKKKAGAGGLQTGETWGDKAKEWAEKEKGKDRDGEREDGDQDESSTRKKTKGAGKRRKIGA